MKSAEDIRPGAVMTGRDLRDIMIGERTMVYGGNGTTARRIGPIVTMDTPAPRAQRVVFPARIVSATKDGANYRWFYAFSEIVYTDADTYIDKTGGRTDSTYGLARNKLEWINGSTGLFGCGVNEGNLPDGIQLQPIPAGVPVDITLIPSQDGESTFPQFAIPNGVDGPCGALLAQQSQITDLQQETQTLRSLWRLFRR